jgi:hypothetical protein
MWMLNAYFNIATKCNGPVETDLEKRGDESA